MIDEFDLSPVQLDALREIGNIGAGNSATALSQVLNKKIDMNVPRVSLVPIEDVPDLVGGPDALIVAVFLIKKLDGTAKITQNAPKGA